MLPEKFEILKAGTQEVCPRVWEKASGLYRRFNDKHSSRDRSDNSTEKYEEVREKLSLPTIRVAAAGAGISVLNPT